MMTCMMTESEISLMVRPIILFQMWLILIDDLPAIRDNIKKGFLETQSKAMSFINNIRKQFDAEESDEEQPPPPPPRKNQGQQAYSRRSGDRDRYDADPQVLGDDFTKLKLQDDTSKLYIFRFSTQLR